MKITSENKRKRGIFTVCVIAALLLALLTGFLIYRALNPRKIRPADPAKKNESGIVRTGRGISYDTYFDDKADVLIAYMYDAEITGNVFTGKMGLKYFESRDRFDSFALMRKYIRSASDGYAEDDYPKYFLLGIDPYAAYKQSCSSRECFEKNLSFIAELAEKHSGTAYHIYLPSDSAVFWNLLSAEERSEARLAYTTLVSFFRDRPNVMLYYVSTQEWVLYSDCIRTEGLSSPIRGDVYDMLLSMDLTENDLRCMVTWANISDVMDSVIGMSSDYDQALGSYAQLEDKHVMFLGDSIFGNYRNSTSVSSFFGDMTGACVYNVSQGGWSASGVSDPSSALGCAFAYLIGNETGEIFDEKCKGLDCYDDFAAAASAIKDTKGENAIFVVEYGLNDYFSGVPSAKYREAMNYIISGIKERYPEAQIIVLSPGYIHIYEDGTLCLGNGTGAPLMEYRDVTSSVAHEQGCIFMSLADDFGFSQPEVPLFLLRDNVHYNERGRYRIAQCIARNL